MWIFSECKKLWKISILISRVFELSMSFIQMDVTRQPIQLQSSACAHLENFLIHYKNHQTLEHSTHSRYTVLLYGWNRTRLTVASVIDVSYRNESATYVFHPWFGDPEVECSQEWLSKPKNNRPSTFSLHVRDSFLYSSVLFVGHVVSRGNQTDDDWVNHV